MERTTSTRFIFPLDHAPARIGPSDFEGHSRSPMPKRYRHRRPQLKKLHTWRRTSVSTAEHSTTTLLIRVAIIVGETRREFRQTTRTSRISHSGKDVSFPTRTISNGPT